MTAGYIKICPRCGHRNDELASACEKDGEFLGMVPAIPAGAAPPLANNDAPLQNVTAAPPAPTAPAKPAAETAAALPSKALYLDVEGAAQYYQIRNGYVVGQAHHTSTADIQLANLPGVNFVHRRHCVFEFRDNEWTVTTLSQPDYTNPSFLNEVRIAPGERVTINNGDKLRFASVTLRIRIIDL